jgi:hypothetical protein
VGFDLHHSLGIQGCLLLASLFNALPAVVLFLQFGLAFRLHVSAGRLHKSALEAAFLPRVQGAITSILDEN